MIAHSNEMGSSFRLIKINYTLDGTTRTINWDTVNALVPAEACMKTAANL